MASREWHTHHPQGERRVVVTQELPGARWLAILHAAGCRVDVCRADLPLTAAEIRAAIGGRCDGAIGQVAETWGEEEFSALRAAGGCAYSNYAVGYNNVDLAAATRCGVAVGNTPGVLTETTAELAAALALAAARRLPEGDRFLRAGKFRAWLPTLLLGTLLRGKTAGIVGAGRIGVAAARLFVEGFRMNLLYFDPRPQPELEARVRAFAAFLQEQGEAAVFCRRAARLEELLAASDLVSLHTPLTPETHHLIDARRLAAMKPDAILVNTSRGPVIDEEALAAHLRRYPGFRAGLDVYEREPEVAAGLLGLENVVLLPHIGSATPEAREGMAVLAAANVAGRLLGHPAWNRPDIEAFLGEAPPAASPSILNARELGIPLVLAGGEATVDSGLYPEADRK